MATEPRELRPSEIVDVADKLAEVATQADIDPKGILARLDLSDARLNLAGSANDVWLRIVRTVHAGASQDAGYRSDAVARLIEALAAQLKGNAELNNLAYTIGQGLQARSSNLSIFLSYASADRAVVDQLYDALQQANPDITLFQDYRSIRPGQDWLDVLRESAGQASLLVCWVSSSYLKSAFCNYEIGIADSSGAVVIPVLADAKISKRIPSYLSSRQMLTTKASADFAVLANNILASLS